MCLEWKDYQTININEDSVPCINCGINIADIENFTYEGKFLSEPLYRKELCRCKKCTSLFILHYDLFDMEGHIFARVFSEDINNPSYNWQELLSEKQKNAISDHLLKCHICRERLSQEILTDAWFASFIHGIKV